MAEKSKSILNKLIKLVIILFPTALSLLNNMPRLIEHETRKTTNNLILTIILAILLTLLLAISWVCILGLFYIFFMSAGLTAAFSLLFILLLNLILLMIVGLFMVRAKNKLFRFFRKHR